MIPAIVGFAAAKMGVTDLIAIGVAEGFLLASLIILALKLLMALVNLIISIANSV